MATVYKVDLWNLDKGWGKVSTPQGQVFVHNSVIDPRPERGEDITGERIILEQVDYGDPRGPKAIRALRGYLVDYVLKKEAEEAWEAGRKIIINRLQAGDELSLENLIGFCKNEKGDPVGFEFGRLAMRSPDDYQRALDVKERWNRENPDIKDQKYVLGYGKPWFADPGLTLVRIADNGKRGEDLEIYAIFKRSDGVFGAVDSWRVEKTDGSVVCDRPHKTYGTWAVNFPDQYRIIPDGGFGIDVPEDWNPASERGYTFELFNWGGDND